MDNVMPFGLQIAIINRAFRKKLDEKASSMGLTAVQLRVLGSVSRLEEKGGGERMSAEERLKSAGFKKIKNGNGDDCCLFCNYYHLSNDKSEASCTLYGVRFLGDFEASEHICNRFDGSELSSLMKAAVEEYSKPERSADQKQNAQASRK